MNSQDIITALYNRLLFRSPGGPELEYWSSKLESEAAAAVIDEFFSSEEYTRAHGLSLGHPPGHYYSPIVDPRTLSRNKMEERAKNTSSIGGVEMHWDAQVNLWRAICEAPRIPYRRYTEENGTYGPGDALILGGVINTFQPRRVIEIGSGFSSARLLDAVEHLDLQTSITFVEPYPTTLIPLMTDTDRSKHSLMQMPVQDVELDRFAALEKNDILFIDSTHVLKTGSDVHFEVFDILPILDKGVIIHFHDIFWPFEYPSGWIFDLHYSWNELYLVRALISYSSQYQILFFNHAFFQLQQEAIAESPAHASAAMRTNPGGGLWLCKR